MVNETSAVRVSMPIGCFVTVKEGQKLMRCEPDVAGEGIRLLERCLSYVPEDKSEMAGSVTKGSQSDAN